MNTLKKLFYFTYAVVALVILGILFFNLSLSELFGVEGTAVFWLTVSLLLLSLLTVGVFGDYFETRALTRKIERLTLENRDLKIQLFEKMRPAGGEAQNSTPKGVSWLQKLGLKGKPDLANRPKTDN